jgi:plasmid stabilization system protein ParE
MVKSASADDASAGHGVRQQARAPSYLMVGATPLQKPLWQPTKETDMPRGDKSSYSDKQKRQAEHIEEGYEHRGVGKGEAERRAWATVNKETGGGKKSGSGRGKASDTSSSKKGGEKGGRAAASSRTHAERSAAAKKGAATRKRNASRKAK